MRFKLSCIRRLNVRAAISFAVCAIAVFEATSHAATITFVGREAGVAGVGNDAVDSFRTNTVAKTFDLDGNNVYGSAGYVLYATDTIGNGNAGGVGAADPLNYTSGSRTTIKSVPSYLTLSNNGQNNIAASFGYKPLDNPSQPISGSVADVESGAALRTATHGTEVSMLNITIGSGAPTGIMRFGIFAGNTDSYLGTIRLTQTIGGAGTVTATQIASGTEDLYLFDIVGATTGDVFTLFLKKDAAAGGNANVVYGGLTIDAVPEPSTVVIGLLGTIALAGTIRRRRLSL